jgi:hypothetical protein
MASEMLQSLVASTTCFRELATYDRAMYSALRQPYLSAEDFSFTSRMLFCMPAKVLPVEAQRVNDDDDVIL